ncbi:MAG: glutamate formimidoyltransferase [Firmicutes bacterium]|nr:glutamate formimidoyltransferase [Bacillota bacterium]
MSKVVQCIPNFSEGRRPEVIEAIVDEIRKVEGCELLDVEPDASHNRVVVTFTGTPEAAKEAAFQTCKKASELIDMTSHEGEHPRMGATDVIPFVPVAGMTMKECVKLAKELGQRIAEELEIPIYLYESAATRPERKNLATVRRGQFEGLLTDIAKPERHPDFGQPKMHPTAGCTAVGARKPLVAFNVNLATTDLSIANAIARKIRGSSGGFVNVKGIGVELEDKNMVQVSMNLVDFKKTSIHHAFEFIKREAARYGVNVVESEIIGLVPMEALVESAIWYLQADGFKNKQILEKRVYKF